MHTPTCSCHNTSTYTFPITSTYNRHHTITVMTPNQRRKPHSPLFMYYLNNADGSVGIATGYGLEGRGSIPGRGKRFLSAS
jgi:hypothetical protein